MTNAVKFDFLNEVSVEKAGVKDDVIFFYLADGDSYIAAQVACKVKKISIELNNTNDPQQSYDVEIDCHYVDSDSICTVLDFDGVHAIIDMPFKLTPNQLTDLNTYLEDIAAEV